MTAETVARWCGFAGAWLLVAGPLYQAVLELRDDTDERDTVQPQHMTAPPPPPSTWWWFLPPVMLILRRRRSALYHRTVLASLTPRERARRDKFIHRATGWCVVALGGSLIAVQETTELAEHHEWPPWVLVTLVVGMFVVVGANTVLHARRQAAPAPTEHTPSADTDT